MSLRTKVFVSQRHSGAGLFQKKQYENSMETFIEK